MSERVNGRPRLNFPARNSLSLLPLLLLLPWLQLLQVPNALAQDVSQPAAVQAPPPGRDAPALDAQEAATLELGRPVERELSGGQKHAYRIPLSEGQHVKVVIKQQGITVGVTLRAPSGEAVVTVDPVVNQDELEVARVAETSGVYMLEISARAKAAAGRYEIRIAELRQATENDRELQRARNLYREYSSLHRQGRDKEARPFITRALEIREKILGPDDLTVAALLGQLALTYSNTGDYANAEPLRLRQLAITEKALGPEHPAVITALIGLGSNYTARGDYQKAEEVYLRALDIFERAGRGESYEVAALSDMLGDVLYATRDYAGAEKYYQRERAVFEKILGPDSYHLAPSLSSLGGVAYDAGDYAKAEEMFRRALALGEKALGQDNIEVTTYRNDLADVYAMTGDYARAEALYLQSLSVHEQKAAMGSPAVRDTLYDLARLYASRGMLDEALKFQSRASELEEFYVGLNLVAGSEREKLAFLDKLSLRSSRNISLHTRLAPTDAAARDLAVTTVLQRKGRVQDVMSEGFAALRRRLGADDRQLLDRLGEVTSELAKLALSGPQKTTADEHRQQIKALEDERESLEAEVSRRSAGFYQQSRPATLDAVRQVIPEGAALVEFAVYRPFDPKKPDNETAYGEPRFVAYVVRRGGEVRWAELGETKSVEAAIAAWREALRDPARKDVQRLARAVDDKVMRPVRSLVGDATRLLLSPDGALNLIPFGALADERGHYLVERYSLTYLTSGRDLLRMQAARESKSGPVVLADPDFGEPALVASRVAARGGAGGPVQIDYTQVFFGPLPGVGAEVRALKGLLPQATFLTGERATKAALKGVNAPSILHVATHGFFLQNGRGAGVGEVSQTKDATRLGRLVADVENPLLRSGLALAGANRGLAGDDNGVLTAFEMANLDLWGTRLVVLSACDTGVGEVKNGDGVYGLRRALVLAGAESQLLSLWPVSDRSTHDLMVGYYKGLLRNEGRGDALRRVQLEMLRDARHAHPYYWAGFIQTGEWANLKGER
jgi:CHAT domain-containing protein/Tfp pilus assembly protein PilF